MAVLLNMCAVPAENVLQIDARIPDEIVSIMDPLGNATHTALSFPLIGEDVLGNRRRWSNRLYGYSYL